MSKFRRRKRKSLSYVTSSTKRETRQSRVVFVQGRQRNLQKSVMHVQSCCFANLNLLLFFPKLRLRYSQNRYTDAEEATESVRIDRVFVLSGLNLETK